MGFLVKHLGGAKEQANTGHVSMDSTDLLSLLLQLTKASAQLDGVGRDASSESHRQKVRQLQELLDAERQRLVGRLRKAGCSELAIQQASNIEY